MRKRRVDLDAKLIGEIAAEQRRQGFTYLSQPLRAALGPALMRGRNSVNFAIEVATNKYLDHLPLERQVRVMAREGLATTSQALWDQVESLASKLAPAWQRLGVYQLTRPLLHVDETSWRIAKKAASRRAGGLGFRARTLVCILN